MAPVNPLDIFPYRAESPMVHAAAVAPSDTVDLPSGATRALWVGGAGSGSLTVIMSGDDTPTTFVGIPAATLLPISVTRVLDTGTDVVTIVALW